MITSWIGWIGVLMMLVGYLFLNTKWINNYLRFNIISCVILFIHEIFNKDYPLIFINFFAGIILTVRLLKGGINKK